MKSNPKVNNNPIAAALTQSNNMTVPDSIIKQKAALEKGRATVLHNKGIISDDDKRKAHDKANRQMGYNFHNHPGN